MYLNCSQMPPRLNSPKFPVLYQAINVTYLHLSASTIQLDIYLSIYPTIYLSIYIILFIIFMFMSNVASIQLFSYSTEIRQYNLGAFFWFHFDGKKTCCHIFNLSIIYIYVKTTFFSFKYV